MKKTFINEEFPHFVHGGDYNPDQWQDSPEVLDEDMRLMKLSGCNAMTVGIFAWAALEPEEGKYDFSFLDKTIDDVYENGGRIVLATPSGARPAWLSQKYPEVLRTNDNGIKQTHGNRHNHCYTSPIYREKVSNINRLLAQRYQKHPAVIAWHLSNEYGGKCYCELCKAAFRDWLKEKYGTLDALNKQWWTAFWAHTYTDWSQIDPPTPIGESSTHGLSLDWKRFVTHQTIDFMKNEIQAVREYTPNIPVTTNLMRYFIGLDYHELAKEIDVISHDLYPAWKAQSSDIETASDAAAIHDLMRCLKHKPFMLMESTPSHVNWHPVNKLKRPGQHMLASLQAVAHGSDTVQYFQWRKSRGSAEKFHGAVVDHVGHENTRVFRDVSELGARLKKLDSIVGTHTVSRVAMLFDWSNRWALNDAQGFQKDDKKYMPTFNRYYHALWQKGINTDVIGWHDDFSKYDLILAPMMYMISENDADKLEAYVKNGGTILCTYITGMVNENDLVHLGGFPGGKLKNIFGIWNEEIDTLYPNEHNTVDYNGNTYNAIDYCELIHPSTAKTLATYTSDFYSGMSAVTVNTYGKGKAYYVAFRDTGAFTDQLTEELLAECAITSDFDGTLPKGVTTHSRTDGDTLYVFLQNFSMEEQTVMTKYEWTLVDESRCISGEVLLKPYETLIMSKKIIES